EQKPVEPVKKKVAVDSPVVPETPPEPDPFTNEVANSNNQPSVNPFDAVPQQPVDLPPKEYEERYEEEVKSESNDSNESQEKTAEFQKVESVGDEAPVNPFAPPSSQPSTVDAKALETTPFDLRDDGVEEVKKEEKDEDPEEIKHAEEQMSPSNETPFGDSGGEQEVKEEVKDTPSAEVSEVVEVKPEDGPSDIPVTVPTEQEIEASSSDKNEVEEFKEEFWDILEQAGFTKQRIITIIVVVILGIVALVGWGKGWFDFSSDNSDVTVKVQEVQEEPAEKEPIEEASNNKDVVVKSSYAVEDQVKPLLIGRSTSGVYRGALSGIEVAFSVGGLDQTFDDKVTYYIDLIRKMENMYATDVYALIDRAVDRRLVLENHLKEMDAIIDEGNSAYNAVVAAMNRFDAQFEVNAASKSVYEEQFFANISALLPTSSHNSLEAFIELSKESVELKAQFNAYEIIRDMLGASLDALEPRYRDIESNVGALIKGIRVFDIPHSDIEAIVPVEN
ncbi:hypothetical protein HON58_02090, partial [Candidatus Peregrinibacteria bacterium]|nr:hypothetical protein [Candidatus Peregrinibacteria bacterium]